jgi:hypothetical protein
MALSWRSRTRPKLQPWFSTVPPGRCQSTKDADSGSPSFDAGGGVLAIMVGGSAERWEEALLAAEPLLETVTIGE